MYMYLFSLFFFLYKTGNFATALELVKMSNWMTQNSFTSLQGKQLENKEAELKALDAFYKEQITQLEKKVGVFLSV